MNNLTLNKRMVPKKALIIYSDAAVNYYHDFFIESRDIKQVGGKNVMMAPVPLSDDIMKKLASTYSKKNSVDISHEPIIADHMIHGSNKLGRTVTMWYRPGMKRLLNFSHYLKIKGEKPVMVPATLYVVINTTLYIFAMSDNQRPTKATKLFNAPYFNIYDDGNVCMGTAHIGKIKGSTYEKEAERFERAFYMAEQNGGNTTGRCKSSLTVVWNAQIKNQKPFPVKEMVQHKKFKTLGDLFNKLIGNSDEEDDN